jgi:hypothetical protein
MDKEFSDVINQLPPDDKKAVLHYARAKYLESLPRCKLPTAQEWKMVPVPVRLLITFLIWRVVTWQSICGWFFLQHLKK